MIEQIIMRQMEACYRMKPHVESLSPARMKQLYTNCASLAEAEIKVENFADEASPNAEFFISFLKSRDACKANFNWVSQQGEEHVELLTADLSLHPKTQTFNCKEYQRRVQNKFFFT